jgi:hypothetical protein
LFFLRLITSAQTPFEVVLLVSLAVVAISIGCAGVLSTARRTRSLSRIACSCLAIGFMASAVQIHDLFVSPPHAQVLVISAAKALAPCLMGILLASMTLIARYLPVEKEEAVRLRTQVILNAWGAARQRYLEALGQKVSALLRATKEDMRVLRDPWRLIPLLIFVGAWPAVGLLEAGLWVLLPYFIGFAVALALTSRWFRCFVRWL